MTSRRPGYDIYGQPTRIDPRDFPDPLTIEPEWQAEAEAALAEHRHRYTRDGCGPAVLLVFVLAALVAAPRGAVQPLSSLDPALVPAAGSADVRAVGDTVGPLPGAPYPRPRQVGAGVEARPWPRPGGPEPGSPVAAGARSELDRSRRELVPIPPGEHYGAPPSLGTAADVSYSGSLAWADPSYGPLYLALREPRGTRVEICASSGCVTRTTTDFGPVLSLWKTGKIADLSARDFEFVCGMSAAQRILHGRCPGTVLILSRPRIALPQTDTKEKP